MIRSKAALPAPGSGVFRCPDGLRAPRTKGAFLLARFLAVRQVNSNSACEHYGIRSDLAICVPLERGARGMGGFESSL